MGYKVSFLSLLLILGTKCSSAKFNERTIEKIKLENPPLEFSEWILIYTTPIKISPKGELLGLLSPGIKIKSLSISSDNYIKVETEKPFKVIGWINREAIGVSVIKPSILWADTKQYKKVAELLPGALLQWQGKDGKMYKVKTVHPLSLTGFINPEDCSNKIVIPFEEYPTQHKLLKKLKQDTYLKGEDRSTPLFKIEKGEIFVVLHEQNGWYYGYIHSPVLIKGWIHGKDLEDWEPPSPLEKLKHKLPYSHETIVEVPLYLDKNLEYKLTILPSETPLIAHSYFKDRVRVETFGSIQIKGWIKQNYIQEVTLDNESLTLPLYTRPYHTPLDRGPILQVEE